MQKCLSIATADVAKLKPENMVFLFNSLAGLSDQDIGYGKEEATAQLVKHLVNHVPHLHVDFVA